jgi:hypothetical protein
MKVCNKCKFPKDKEEFCIDRSRPDGLAGRCRQCQSKYDKDRSQTEERKVEEWKRGRRRRGLSDNYPEDYTPFAGPPRGEQSKRSIRIRTLRETALERKRDGCIECEETEPVAIDFHHLRDKKFAINKGIFITSMTIEELNAEMDKCITICSNCHRKLHAGLIQISI